MLISKLSEETAEDGRAGMSEGSDRSPEYRTASELFDLMTKNSHFDSHDDDSLTTRDLVLLYKNIDIGTKLMNEANGNKVNEYVVKRPNQYVETVVYNDEPESDSELSEIYSNEDLHNIFMFNQERIDFRDKSFENLLCHKLGGMEIKSSGLSMEYDKNFLFKDPYIKNQLKNLNLMSCCSGFNNVFSSSLIDYICCKRLEDNYNFYMDNIIRYVQHTIDQLKRISNGDFLTERAKEKWRQVNYKDQENTKVLATSTSIPLHVECKSDGNATWDDIVHSEVDVRSLSKILEKKIVVEIPKLICGSYRLYSKRCADNLIIRCKRDDQIIEKKGKESRVDVVLQLKRSQTGQVMSNISSIMVLQTSQALPDLHNILPLPYKEESYSVEDNSNEPVMEVTKVTVMEFDKDTDTNEDNNRNTSSCSVKSEQITDDYTQNINSLIGTNDYPCSENERNVSTEVSNQYSGESNVALREILNKPVFPFGNEKTYNLISPDELRITMQRLNTQTSLREESSEDVSLRNTTKKKSTMRVRIKSPYENKSFLLEEKKRKRLLEIRERREKKKQALGEICKISKNKYGKVAIMPQASNSVTKLSITNKSFYNSIYGNSLNIENKFLKTRNRKEQKHSSTSSVVPLESNKEAYFESPMLTPEKNSKKYINRSYYLDDADTEVMYTQIKRKDDEDNNNVRNPCSGSNSTVSNEFNASFGLLPQHGTSDSNPNEEQGNVAENNAYRLFSLTCGTSSKPPILEIYTVPENSPKRSTSPVEDETKKNVSSLECRKSIDKLYQLMKKNPNGQNDDDKSSKTAPKINSNNEKAGGCSTIQGSDSGTSVKHHTASSNPSSYSFDKNTIAVVKPKPVAKKNDHSTVASKVIINSKQQISKVDMDKIRKDNRKVHSPIHKTPSENPLKAISQLLHEFDNVQKTRHKNEMRTFKRTETILVDDKNSFQQDSFKRRSRLDQHNKKDEKEKKITPNASPKDKRSKPMSPMELARIPLQPLIEDRGTKKKIIDIIDEAKEARGEAVRGPSKFNSRLNTLAQPKRSYVQAHSKEYHNKYGRNVVADRLQRLAAAAAPLPGIERNVGSANSRNRANKFRTDNTSMASVKQPASFVPHLDNYPKVRRSASSSPNRTNQHNNVSVGFNISDPTSDAKLQCSEAMKKMVAVESYVKNHYGRSRANSPKKSKDLLLSGNKSRVPLIPADFELASLTSSPTAEEASEIGNKLHRIIDSMIKNAPPLTELPECDRESNSKVSKTTDFCEDKVKQERSDSDYRINVFEDTNLETAVESINNNSNRSEVSVAVNGSKFDLEPANSRLEMERLESALYNQISGAFQKRLRIKNLTLTPKQSLQQVFLLQSGDAGSLVVKSTVSNLKNKSSLQDLKVMPVLSNSHLDWNFAEFPMKIATVGYAFPKHQNSQCSLSSKVKLLEVSSTACSDNDTGNNTGTDTSSNMGRSDKDSQCFKGIHQEKSFDTSAQVDVNDEGLLLSPVVSLNRITVSNKPMKNNLMETYTEETNKIDKKYVCCKDNDLVVETNTCKQLTDDIKDHAVESVNAINSISVIYANDDNEAAEQSHNEIDCTTDNTKFGQVNSVDIAKPSGKLSPKTDEVDYTTSLDLLVGILNEIQKITCQNQMAAANNHPINENLEMIALKNVTNFEKAGTNVPSKTVVLNSFNELRRHESNSCICSHYNICNDNGKNIYATSILPEINNKRPVLIIEKTQIKSDKTEIKEQEKMYENGTTEKTRTSCVDKEVSANLMEKEYVNTFTNIPSSLVPLTVNRSVNITNSVIGVISEPSTHSMLKFSDYQTIYSNSLFSTQSIKNIMQLPQVGGLVDQPVLTPRNKAEPNSNEKSNSFPPIRNGEDIIRIEKSLIVHSELRKYCVDSNIDLDPMLKIKRDILVTVYSILVLTVFAALSFPDLIYLQ